MDHGYVSFRCKHTVPARIEIVLNLVDAFCLSISNK